MSKIKVVIIRYDENIRESVLKIEEIDDNLETMNNIVGGYIEMPSLSRELSKAKISCTINEEGKIKRLHPTAYSSFSSDLICGTIVFAGFDDNGSTIGLSNIQIDLILRQLRKKVEIKSECSVSTKSLIGSLIYIIN